MYIPKKKEVVWVPPHVLQARGNLMWSFLAMGSFFGICVLGVMNYANNRVREKAMERRLKGPRVAIIGGSVAGSNAAASLTQYHPDVQVNVFEPSREHCFYGMTALAAAGHRSYDLRCNGPNTLYSSPAWTVTRDADLTPQTAVKIDPKAQTILDDKGNKHPYDVLVLACGSEFDFTAVKGLKREHYDKHGIAFSPGIIRDGVCTTHQGNVVIARVPWTSEYTRPHEGTYIGVSNTLWKFLQFFGRIASCTTVQVHVATPDATPSPYLQQRHNDAIMDYWNERDVTFHKRTALTEVDPKKKLATFTNLDNKTKMTIPYRLLVLDLPRKAPAVIAASGLSADGLSGFADVDPETLQHRKYPNIFALGDCAALKVNKSYGAIYAQVPVMTHNVTQYLSNREVNARYDGYSSHHITMSTWRAMWPEMLGPEYVERLSQRTGKSADEVIASASGHYWNDADWRYWKGFLQGFYMQSTCYEFMHWLVFSRAWFCSPYWFSGPDFPEGTDLPLDSPKRVTLLPNESSSSSSSELTGQATH